jgi:hypothetical protein
MQGLCLSLEMVTQSTFPRRHRNIGGFEVYMLRMVIWVVKFEGRDKHLTRILPKNQLTQRK